MTILENDFQLNDVSGKWRSAKYRFNKMTFDILYSFGNFTIRQMTIWPIDIRRHDVSVKRRFDEMTFRESDVAPTRAKRGQLTSRLFELVASLPLLHNIQFYYFYILEKLIFARMKFRFISSPTRMAICMGN